MLSLRLVFSALVMTSTTKRAWRLSKSLVIGVLFWKTGDIKNLLIGNDGKTFLRGWALLPRAHD